MAAGSVSAACRPDVVELKTKTNTSARFYVELADSDASRAQGLMHRPQMAKGAGMLFLYPKPTHAVFWMKNTLIPLDMIFLDATGTVTHIHENAIPHDETGIDGGWNVSAVLEINGGLARKLGLQVGSTMRHPAFAQQTAAWPCK